MAQPFGGTRSKVRAGSARIRRLRKRRALQGQSRRDHQRDHGVSVAGVVVLIPFDGVPLHLIEDVEHAHSPGVDVVVSGDRDLSGCGLRLDVLGNRAEDVQAVSQARSHDIGWTSEARPPWRRVRGIPPRAVRGWRLDHAKARPKKQGRRRSIPSTTLPAPDIEIGSRHPVNLRMPGILTGMCEPVHIRQGKLAKPCRWGGGPQ